LNELSSSPTLLLQRRECNKIPLSEGEGEKGGEEKLCLLHIETKYYSATIGSWRSSTRDKYFESWFIAISICKSGIIVMCLFIDIGNRV